MVGKCLERFRRHMSCSANDFIPEEKETFDKIPHDDPELISKMLAFVKACGHVDKAIKMLHKWKRIFRKTEKKHETKNINPGNN